MKRLGCLAALALVAGCADIQQDKTVDRSGLTTKPLADLKAGIWVDPNSCDHWMINDGSEGYLSARLDKYGKPFCSGVAPPNTFTTRTPDAPPMGKMNTYLVLPPRAAPSASRTTCWLPARGGGPTASSSPAIWTPCFPRTTSSWLP